MSVGSISGNSNNNRSSSSSNSTTSSNSSNSSSSLSSNLSNTQNTTTTRDVPLPRERPADLGQSTRTTNVGNARIQDGFDRPMDRKTAVQNVQRALGMSQVDGIFGPKTHQAVEQYQRQQGLKVDGIVGPQTWGSLFGGARPEGVGLLRMQDSFNVSTRGGGTTGVSRPGEIHAGGGWGGTERLADRAIEIAREMGIGVSSTKRGATTSIGSTSRSDHHVSQRNAFAVDLPVTGPRGAELARKIGQAYGLTGSTVGNFNRHVIEVDGERYRMQVLWGVKDHWDHVHVGFKKL